MNAGLRCSLFGVPPRFWLSKSKTCRLKCQHVCQCQLRRVRRIRRASDAGAPAQGQKTNATKYQMGRGYHRPSTRVAQPNSEGTGHEIADALSACKVAGARIQLPERAGFIP